MRDLFSRERLFNLYTLRAVLVAALAVFASALPGPLVEELNNIVAAIDGGDKGVLVLAVFGGVMALLDIIRKSKTPAMSAGVLTPGDAAK